MTIGIKPDLVLGIVQDSSRKRLPMDEARERVAMCSYHWRYLTYIILGFDLDYVEF